MAAASTQVESLEDILDKSLNDKDKNEVYNLLYGRQLKFVNLYLTVVIFLSNVLLHR